MAREKRVSGDRIKQLREARRLLQHDLASNLRRRGFGTTQAQVSRWEGGQEPRSSVLRALAEELGVTVDELYGDDEEDDSSMPTHADMLEALRPFAPVARMLLDALEANA